MLTHETRRSLLAITGIVVALLLVFLQLGFYFSVPRGGMLILDSMRFDVLLVSKDYIYQSQSSDFPRRRLYQALALPEVAGAAAFYQASGEWMQPTSRIARDVFIMAFDPTVKIFDVPDIERQQELLRRPDTVLVDAATRPEFGPIAAGRTVEIDRRTETIAGTYTLGTGFVGLGAAVTSDVNFIRLFPNRSYADVNLGLVTLKAGADAASVAARLRSMLPADTTAVTRDELAALEVRYWTRRTSTGLVFGFGAVIALVVGMVILNQILSTQILQQLPQYATLKAIGYTNHHLRWIVVTLALIMATIGYLVSLLLSSGIYALLRRATLLPVEMSGARMLTVLALAWGMSALSALIAVRVLQRADPVDLF